MTRIAVAICLLALSALPYVTSLQSILGSSQISYLEPSSGCYMGVLPSAASQGNLSSYVATLGWSPAVYGSFANIPLSSQDKVSLPSFLAKMADLGAIAFLTIEPKSGLSSYTTSDVQELVDVIAGYEIIGLWCIIRFAHEMNGNWYAWGQQPAAYVTAWQKFATVVRAGTRRTALLWSPNQATQYPFGKQPYSPAQGSADYNAMDTNKDGSVDMHDDPFTPFWPGDEYVDWVGLSLEYFGLFNLKNSLPMANEFYNKITGNYNGQEGDCRAVPDFYEMFSGSSSPHHKPMTISETALGFDVMNEGGGPSELDAKSAWWKQVFSSGGNTSDAVDMSVYLPNIKMISWFDQLKIEGAFSGDQVSWSLSGTESVASAFNSYIVRSNSAKKYWLHSADFLSATNGVYLANSGNGSGSPPATLPFYHLPSGGTADSGRCDWTLLASSTLLSFVLGYMMLT